MNSIHFRKLILAALLISCSSLWGQVSLTLDESSPADVANLVGFSTGFNHRFMVQKVGTVYTSQVRPELLSQMEKIHSPVLRFPGGVIGNFYHLYPEGFDCTASTPCVSDFAPGYGLRNIESGTHLASMQAQQNFEDNTNHSIETNWLVSFANLVEAHKNATGEDIEIIYMANVMSHFKFGSQGTVFNPSDARFQRLANETRDALRYLIGVRQLKVVGVELGTELYAGYFANNNDMDVDDFIGLIPTYRNLVDAIEVEFNLPYDLEVAVPISHTHNLNPNANNWTRKLCDAAYYPGQDYDAWIIHDYQDIIPFCDKLNCNQCTDWIYDECELNEYSSLNANGHFDECGPSSDDNPTAAVLESVFSNRKNMVSDTFHHGISDDLVLVQSQLRSLSGKATSAVWLTEWNVKFDGGCRDNLFSYNWKAVNQFFGNTFLHGVSIFEWLHSFYEQNAQQGNTFAKYGNFHSFVASSKLNPIFNAPLGGGSIAQNASGFSFEFASVINEKELKKIEVNTPADNDSIVFHAYHTPTGTGNDFFVYLFYSNKSDLDQPLDLSGAIPSGLFAIDPSSASTRFISADHLYSASNNTYTFGMANFTSDPIDTSNAHQEIPVTFPYELPRYSYGFVKLEFKSSTTGIDNQFSLAKDEISLYPNPFKNQLTLDYHAPIHERVHVEIRDLMGRLVDRHPSLQAERTVITTENLSQGNYVLSIIGAKSGHRLFTGRIVKL